MRQMVLLFLQSGETKKMKIVLRFSNSRVTKRSSYVFSKMSPPKHVGMYVGSQSTFCKCTHCFLKKFVYFKRRWRNSIHESRRNGATLAKNRVTRLGEFLPIGRFVLNIRYFFTEKVLQ
jgi:hypothetical protein